MFVERALVFVSLRIEISYKVKKWFITAVAIIMVGAIICFATAAIMHFDFEKLDNGKYETNTYTVGESFRYISVTASAEKVFFKPAKDGKCTVVCLKAFIPIFI